MNLAAALAVLVLCLLCMPCEAATGFSRKSRKLGHSSSEASPGVRASPTSDGNVVLPEVFSRAEGLAGRGAQAGAGVAPAVIGPLLAAGRAASHADPRIPEVLPGPSLSAARSVVLQLLSAGEVASLGGDLLAQKAQTGAVVFGRLMMASAEGARTGNVTQAMDLARAAVAEAEARSRDIDAAASPQASASAGMLGVLLLAAAAWATELVLTKQLNEHAEEELEPLEDLEECRFLRALGFARYIAALHVVLDHFWKRPVGDEVAVPGDTWAVFARWGLLSAPLFFVLGGFCSTYWKLIGPRRTADEDPIWAMVRKVRSWYPLYALSLTWCAVRLLSKEAEDWSHYIANMCLINSIIWDNEQFPYLSGGWWLCYFMVFLLTWSTMYKVLYDSVYPTRGRDSSTANNDSVLWTVFLTSWAMCIPSALFEWYFIEDFPPFAIIQYWPSFLFGQALAFWFVLHCMRPATLVPDAASGNGRRQGSGAFVMLEQHEIMPVVRYGPTIAYVVLGLQCFMYSPYDNFAPTNQPVTPLVMKGGLLPLLGLLVLGLACEADPIAKLFARKPFLWADRLAFGTFALQVPVHNAVQDVFGFTGLTWTFSVTLLATTLLGHWWIERPWRKYLALRCK